MSLSRPFLIKILLWLGSLFFFVEAVIHGFGLQVLEHDKIFLPTHDRYIALFALTYAALLILISTDLKKYRDLFFVTMGGILLSMANALLISRTGGYSRFFPVESLDKELGILGAVFVVWYIATWIFWWIKK